MCVYAQYIISFCTHAYVYARFSYTHVCVCVCVCACVCVCMCVCACVRACVRTCTCYMCRIYLYFSLAQNHRILNATHNYAIDKTTDSLTRSKALSSTYMTIPTCPSANTHGCGDTIQDQLMVQRTQKLDHKICFYRNLAPEGRAH